MRAIVIALLVGVSVGACGGGGLADRVTTAGSAAQESGAADSPVSTHVDYGSLVSAADDANYRFYQSVKAWYRAYARCVDDSTSLADFAECLGERANYSRWQRNADAAVAALRKQQGAPDAVNSCDVAVQPLIESIERTLAQWRVFRSAVASGDVDTMQAAADRTDGALRDYIARSRALRKSCEDLA